MLAAVLKPPSVDFDANKVLVDAVALSVSTSLSVLKIRLCQSVCQLEVLLYEKPFIGLVPTMYKSTMMFF